MRCIRKWEAKVGSKFYDYIAEKILKKEIADLLLKFAWRKK